ncbi:MAG: NAD(+) kinase [Gammaproteobacteria bacterium]|nr:NAD(+) kinase [Gammaproteobacteria bacterium]
MTKRSFQTIGLIGKSGDSSIADTVQRLAAHLLDRGCQVLLDEDTASNLPKSSLPVVNRATLSSRCDLTIIIGGDGTLLQAARTLSDGHSALVGINLGRLGFLVDISHDTMLETMDSLLAGNYVEDPRFLLHCRIIRNGEDINDSIVLNDVAIHKWNVARMIELETYINGHFVSLSRSDGLVISTPTGSTAYALSAGGPILHPALDAIALVPLCPHTMTNRPIVIPGTDRIEVVIRSQHQVRVTCDGQASHEVMCDDRVVITKMKRPLRLIHPLTHNHFDTLRVKLHWAESPQNTRR